MRRSWILRTDSYKIGHGDQYPNDMEELYAYFESRGGRYSSTVFFGLQYYMLEYLQGHVFNFNDIEKAKEFCAAHFGREDYFNASRWEELHRDYDGRLPISIKALPEGTIAPIHTPLFTVEATDSRYAWLVTYIEAILMKVWYPTTIATQSYYLREQLTSLLDAYSDSRGALDFLVHDFGYRGTTSEEQAEIGGGAHLLSFKGTDNLGGIDFLNQYYGDKNDPHKMRGFSVPATEHSIILSYGEENEEECYRKYLQQYPKGIIACVSDTYDIDVAVANFWCGTLSDRVENREGVLVVRPDSGDPIHMVLTILERLWDRFGGTYNSRSLRLLDPHVRVIQGDGMDYESIPLLYEALVEHNFDPTNLTVGAGGGMLQKVNRDTNKFAYKASEVVRDGVAIGIAKHPKHDASKASKAGRFSVVKNAYGVLQTREGDDRDGNLLREVFRNGRVLIYQSADEISARMKEETFV